jgi:hypothetical protein
MRESCCLDSLMIYLITSIDDAFISADDVEKLLVCLKLVLMVARDAKIKFSIENQFLSRQTFIWLDMILTQKCIFDHGST